jgi:protein-S-isoprenylcysteine O-methyltransferase Ste14
VPPPVVTATAALLMWLLALSFPALDLDLPARTAVATILAAVALIIGSAAIYGFRRARTTIHPMKPQESSALVTGGIYRATRNPMYLAMLLILIGWAYIVANPAALAILPLFVAYLNRFQIAPEERALRARFGAGFEDYCRRVRRWL